MIEKPQPFDINARIVELVQECWREHQMPLLLSRLGTQEDGRIAEIARQQAGGLADYIRFRLSDRIRVVQHSAKPMVIAAIPSAVAADMDGTYDPILEKTFSRTESSILRFHPAIWAAFRKPLVEGNKRYIKIHPPFHFVDTSSTVQPKGHAELEPRHILSPAAESAEIVQSLQAWLEENGLEASSFVSTVKPQSARLPSDDLLGRLLHALDPDDLRRVSMPLDVVEKLRRERP